MRAASDCRPVRRHFGPTLRLRVFNKPLISSRHSAMHGAKVRLGGQCSWAASWKPAFAM